MNAVVIWIALVGLSLGSFVNALVWRLYQQGVEDDKYAQKQRAKKGLSITRGRSMCPHCNHTLGALDLLPVASWVALKGKCRYCKKPIGWQYPLVELLTCTLFIVSYLSWPYEFSAAGIVAFAAWLVILTGLMALLVFDIKWMILPNRIIFPLYGAAAIYVLARVVMEGSPQPLLGVVAGIAVGGGIFYVLFQISEGRWIGGGDVKLGFLLGALSMSATLAGMLLFFASILGTLFSIPLLLRSKSRRNLRIPFGPFLIVAGIIVVLYGEVIMNWYLSQLISI